MCCGAGDANMKELEQVKSSDSAPSTKANAAAKQNDHVATQEDREPSSSQASAGMQPQGAAHDKTGDELLPAGAIQEKRSRDGPSEGVHASAAPESERDLAEESEVQLGDRDAAVADRRSNSNDYAPLEAVASAVAGTEMRSDALPASGAGESLDVSAPVASEDAPGPSTRSDVPSKEHRTPSPAKNGTGGVVEQASEGVAAGSDPSPRKQLVVHFNDVYNCDAGNKDPCGGATRFAAKLRKVKSQDPNALVLFSGDALYPSSLSVGNHGQHQAEILEAIGADVACLGNHDLDGGAESCQEIFSTYMPSIPMLCANLIDKETGEPICGCKRTLTKEVAGIKYGFLGVVEEDWLATLGAVDPKTIQYLDFVEEGRRLAKQLLGEGCDVIIAVTHSREANDFLLAEQVDDIDIIAGGHDHHYSAKVINNCLVLNSGTDYRDFTEIWIDFPEGESEGESRRFPPGTLKFEHLRHEIFLADPEAEDIKKIVDFHSADLRRRQAARIATVDTVLDSRAPHIRGRETAAGNLVADVIRKATKAEVVFINGGSLRADDQQGPGDYTLGDLMRLCPMQTGLPTISITGEFLADALDHAVSSVPKTAGSFPVLSGVHFRYDATKEPGSRVDRFSIQVNGEPVDMERRYRVTTTDYMFGGGDGFSSFDHKREEVDVVVDLENAPILPVLMRNHFRRVDVANGFIALGKKKEVQAKELAAVAHRLSSKVKKTLSHKHDGEAAGGGGGGSEGSPGHPTIDEDEEEGGEEGEEEGGEEAAGGGGGSDDKTASADTGGIGEAGGEQKEEEAAAAAEQKEPDESECAKPLAAELVPVDLNHPDFGIKIAPLVEGRIIETSGSMAHLYTETTESIAVEVPQPATE